MAPISSVAIQRGNEVVVPRGSVELMADDVLVLGAESVGSSDQHHIELKELELRQHNPWSGQRIRDLEPLHRESRQLAELTARYYDRGYHKNAYYTL